MSTVKLQLFILALFSLQTVLVIGQEKSKKDHLIKPPNGIQLYDNVFIDKTEISNQAYLEYIFYVVRDSMKIQQLYIYDEKSKAQSSMKQYSLYISKDINFKTLMLDTACWDNFKLNNDTAQKEIFNYLYDPIYRIHPAIGVSYDQALAFCKWRGDAVTSLFDTEEYKEKYSQLRRYKYVIEYRLPTISEWEYAAKGGLNISDYPYGLKKITKTKKLKKLINNVCGNNTELENSPSKYKDKINSYKFNIFEDFDSINLNMEMCETNYYLDIEKNNFHSPNKYKIHNMLGNVSEMVMEKGICKGGSYLTKFNDLSITKNYNYTTPTNYLGFRCVAIVHKIKR